MSTQLLAQAIDGIATLIERGEFADAEKRAQSALLSMPHAEIWRLLAIAQLQTGKIDAAKRGFAQAHKIDPGSVEVLCNLAAVETLQGNLDAAQQALQKALALAPNHAGALSSFGRLRHRAGDYAAAAECFERNTRAHPDAPEAWLDLANTRVAQFQWNVAETHVRQALTLQPRSADAWYMLGYLFERQGNLHEALQPYRNSMEIQARPQTAHNLALVLDQLGQWHAAARMMERALSLSPNLLEALSQLTFMKRRLCEWDGLPMLAGHLKAAVDARIDGVAPFSFLVEESSPAQQLQCARTFARNFASINATAQPAPVMHKREAGDLRVGFVSSGFAEHATGLLLVELIERLRAAPLQTIAFATTPDDASVLRRRLVAAFGEFHDVSLRSPAAIAKIIRDADVDILLDIDGYCMNSMPQIFAHKPAPIQINYLAYPGSLGAPWYDYLIADDFLIPADRRSFYDEKIAWLPRCYQPTDTTRIVDEPPAREACGLPASGFVYCCFNNTWKFTPQSFALWIRILSAVPESILWLLDGPAGNSVSERLCAAAQSVGIDPKRIVFSPKLKHAEYLARYRHADLFLDTNPYNAHTTASDALYAGCPVLTRVGDTFASRVAGSLNRQLGLDDLVVASEESYLAKAIELGTQPQLLQSVRAKLAQSQTRSRLFDMRAYAEDFARLLKQIAEHARSGAQPAHISVSASLLPPGEGADCEGRMP